MGAYSVEPHNDIETVKYPLLELMDNRNNQEHIIDIRTGVTTSSNREFSRTDVQEDQASSGSSRTSISHRIFPSRVHTRMRGDNYVSRGRNAFNSGLWIFTELVITLGQVVASVVVLSLSRHERPRAPLFAWIVGYIAGCLASIPILLWRYYVRDLPEPGQVSFNENPSRRSVSYPASSLTSMSEQENQNRTETPTTGGVRFSSRINGLLDHGKMVLDCFFAVWFVVGNVWIFAGHSSLSDAPNLYTLCLVLIILNCVGYAMPFVLCATVCCCLPCILSYMGSRPEFNQARGASPESINALPKFKFKLKKSGTSNDVDKKNGRGGVFAFGTEIERALSDEDAVCCICLEDYVDDDELRELPCTHLFHAECVDKWLKNNALCPLCKCEVAASQPTDH